MIMQDIGMHNVQLNQLIKKRKNKCKYQLRSSDHSKSTLKNFCTAHLVPMLLKVAVYEVNTNITVMAIGWVFDLTQS
jgi:hypothetical protein